MSLNDPIGIFDSGLGGLSVVREVIRQIPDEKIVYFGDTARVPYGSKSKATIVHYSEQILNFLNTKNVKAIVVACNTASAYALEELRSEIKVPIIGVVKPGARVACNATKNKKVGLIGTEGTVRSGIYEQFIKQINPEIQVFPKACPLFVPLVEEGWWHDEVTIQVAERYLEGMKTAGVDTLIMGCTHYPFLRSTIRSVLGDHVNLINPAYETAVELRHILEWNHLTCENTQVPEEEKYKFYVSDDPNRFYDFANSVLKFDISGAEKINIEEY